MCRKLTTTTTWQFQVHRLLLSLIYSNHKFSYLWLWDSTQRFQIFLKVLYAVTQAIIKLLKWILILITLYVCMKVNISQISQKIQHTTQQKLLKCSYGFSFYTWSETLNPTCHMGLGWFENSAKNYWCKTFDQLSLSYFE